MVNFKPRTQTDLPGGDQRVDCDGLLDVVEQVEVEVVVEVVVEVMVRVEVSLVMEVEEVVVEEVEVVEVEGVGPERRKRSVGEVERTPGEEVVGWVEGESPPGLAQAGAGGRGPGTGWGWGGRQ